MIVSLHGHHNPKVGERHMLGKQAVGVQRVPPEALHDAKVLQLVPCFCEMQLQKVVAVARSRMRERKEASTNY